MEKLDSRDEITVEARDYLTGETPSQMIARDQANNQEGFFTQGWTQEHTSWAIVVLVIVLIAWFKPGGKIR